MAELLAGPLKMKRIICGKEFCDCLEPRERIKRHTIEHRRSHHREVAAQHQPPDKAPHSPLIYAANWAKCSDDGHGVEPMAKVAVRSVHRHGYIDGTTIGPPEDDGALPSTDQPPPSYNVVDIGPDDTIGVLVSRVKAWALSQSGGGHTLNFWSHGAPGYLYLGKDGISSANVGALAPLAPHFSTVRISGCNVAFSQAGKAFCKTLAMTLNATVEAGVEVQMATQILLTTGTFVDDDKFEGAYFRFSPAGVMTGPFRDRKSVLGKWTFEIPNWQGATASERYKTGWTGILNIYRESKSPRGAAGAPETGLTSGDCFWHPLTSLTGHNGTWQYYLTESSPTVVEHLMFSFEDDGRQFVGDVTGNVCEGHYTNPGWPNGYFRLTKRPTK